MATNYDFSALIAQAFPSASERQKQKASDFLNKWAQDSAQKTDAKYGANAYGGTAWLKDQSVTADSSVPHSAAHNASFEIGPTTEKTNAARAYEQRTGVDTSIAENVKQWRGETPDYSRSAFIPQVTGKVGVTVAPTTTRTSSGHTNPNGGTIGVQRYTRDELLGYDLTSRDRELETPNATATAARNAVAQVRRDKAAGRATEDDVKAARRNLAAAQAAVSAVKDKYELAKRVQYEKKGDDELKALPSAALKQIEALYNVTTSTDAKSRLAAGVAASMGGPNRLSSMAAANRKAQDDAYAALATLGYSRQKVDQLLDYYTRRQDLEKYLAAYQDAEEKVNAGTGSAIGANLLSVGTNLASGAGQVDLTLQRIGQALSQDEWRKEAPLNYYSYGMLPYAWTQGVRQTTSGNILYDENGDERGGASKVLNSMYQAGMSMADSAAVAGMSMLGLPPGVGLTLLGGSAATSAMVDAVERGATDTQAVLTGLAAGVAEAMWERISLDSVLEIKALAKSAGKDTARRVTAQVLLNQAKTEGLEEIATDLTNAIMDQIINSDLSDFNTSYRQYLADGMTPEQAKTKAWADFAGQVALSGVMGAVTGGIMGAGGLGLQGAFANHKAKTTYSGNTAALLARAEMLGIDNKDTKTLAEKKDSATGGQIRAVVEDIVRQEIADTQEAKVARIERELKEAGAKGNVKQMAEALAARLTVEQTYADRPVEQAAAESVLQESLSRSLQQRLIRSEAAQMVYLQELTYLADETATTAAEEAVAAAQTVAADTNFVGKTGTALADSVLAAARTEGVTNRMLTELVKNGGDVEAMTALGVDPAKLTTNTERRAALKQAIQARVESEKNNSTNPVAQNAQTEYNESEPTVRVDGRNGTWNMTRAEFKKWQQDYYTARNIAMSEEQLDNAFDRLLAVQAQEVGTQEVGVQSTGTEEPAPRVYLEPLERPVDYEEFQQLAKGSTKADGTPYTDDEIHRAFDAGVEATRDAVAEYDNRQQEARAETEEPKVEGPVESETPEPEVTEAVEPEVKESKEPEAPGDAEEITTEEVEEKDYPRVGNAIQDLLSQHMESKAPAASSVAQVDDAAEGRVILHTQRNDSLGSAKAGFDPYSAAELEHGTQESRPGAYRHVDAPVSMDGSSRVSQSTVTVGSSEATPAFRLKDITDAVVGGKLSHEVQTDKLANNRARAALDKKGWDKAYMEWAAKVKSGNHDKDTVAMGALLLDTAGNNKEADGNLYVDIISDYAKVLTRAGQILQAGKLIQQLTPMGQLYGIQRSIDDMNDEIKSRAEKAGIDPELINVDPILLVRYRDAETEEAREEALKDIYQDIADQIPATGMDKFTAWRYMAMLGNFRTQVRNVIGNAGFQPVRMLKESAAGLMEALVNAVSGGQLERTTSALYDPATFKAAKDLFKKDSDLIMSGGKYQDSYVINREIDNRRRIFKSKALETWRKATNKAMDKGDVVFCSFTYRDSLARFMKANHTTWDEASPELREKARLKAIKDAAEATYRDTNDFSTAMAEVARQNPGENKVKKALHQIGEGVLPFRKTPANILLRAVEYSPLNLVDNAIKIAQYNLAKAETVENPGKVAQVYNKAVTASKEAEVTGADIISSLAKTLTGSALVLLGTALASMGVLKGKAPEDDKEKEFWDLTGHQEYAIEIGGKSYTLDWLAPEAIPLYLGANLHQAAIEGGLTLKETIEAVGSITDPLLQMSMLQGVNDALENASTYGDESALPRFTQNSMWSYVTQLVPTIVGQTNRAITNTRMQTYVDKNKDLPDFWQQLSGKLTSRIPGLNNLTHAQIEYIDAWGRTEKNADTPTLNALYQFFSPGYASTIEESDMEKELQRLYEATGEKGVLISRAPKYFNVDSERVDLTGAQYLTYSQTRGQTAYRVITQLTDSTAYKKLTDAQKAKAAENVYKYSNEIAKERTVRGYTISDSWIIEARTDANDYGIPVSTYIALYSGGISNVTGIKNANGNTIENTASMRKARIIYNSLPGLTGAQYQKLLEDFDVGKEVRGWSPALIENKLKALGD